jgi:hypothetical protein
MTDHNPKEVRTMKRTMTVALTALLVVAVAACTSTTGLKSGAAAGEAMIKMVPKTSTGVVALDVRRLMTTDAVVKALQDPKNKEKLDEFVKMSGIDPTKDIYYLGGAGQGTLKGAFEGGLIITLKYDRAKLQGLIKEKAPEAKEELYEGVTVYSNVDGDKAESKTRMALLDATHIVVGNEAGVRGIIDVAKKKAESLAKNPEMMALVKRADKSGYLWGAFAVSPELIKKGIEASPQFKALEGVTGLVLSFDNRMDSTVIDIKTIGGTKEQNANLASVLTGFRALGAMTAGKEPAVGELLNGVAITSGADYTDLSINIPNELAQKLGQMARSKAGEFMRPKKEASPEEKK